jgi:hypothetical protein
MSSSSSVNQNQNQQSNGGGSAATAAAATSNSGGTTIAPSSGGASSTAHNKEPTTSTAKQQQQQAEKEAIQTMSTSALEAKLRQLRQASQEHSQILTQKLASSQGAGQNLLHIGTSLSTLPPDLHNLSTQLHPVFLSTVEGVERNHVLALQALVGQATAVRATGRRVTTAADAADLYADFCAAEKSVQAVVQTRGGGSSGGGGGGGYFNGKKEQQGNRPRQSQQHQNGDDDESDNGNDANIYEDGDVRGTL